MKTGRTGKSRVHDATHPKHKGKNGGALKKTTSVQTKDNSAKKAHKGVAKKSGAKKKTSSKKIPRSYKGEMQNMNKYVWKPFGM